MDPNPDRNNYDSDRHTYDENTDTIHDDYTGKDYDGDGNEIDHYFD